jgi:hypothetical protein
MSRRVALIRTDVSEELSASIIRVTRIDELRTLAVTSNRRTLRRNGNGNYVRLEVFTAVTVKNVVFWDIKTQFVLHRRHITSPLQSPAS